MCIIYIWMFPVYILNICLSVSNRRHVFVSPCQIGDLFLSLRDIKETCFCLSVSNRRLVFVSPCQIGHLCLLCFAWWVIAVIDHRKLSTVTFISIHQNIVVIKKRQWSLVWVDIFCFFSFPYSECFTVSIQHLHSMEYSRWEHDCSRPFLVYYRSKLGLSTQGGDSALEILGVRSICNHICFHFARRHHSRLPLWHWQLKAPGTFESDEISLITLQAVIRIRQSWRTRPGLESKSCAVYCTSHPLTSSAHCHSKSR